MKKLIKLSTIALFIIASLHANLVFSQNIDTKEEHIKSVQSQMVQEKLDRLEKDISDKKAELDKIEKKKKAEKNKEAIDAISKSIEMLESKEVK